MYCFNIYIYIIVWLCKCICIKNIIRIFILQVLHVLKHFFGFLILPLSSWSYLCLDVLGWYLRHGVYPKSCQCSSVRSVLFPKSHLWLNAIFRHLLKAFPWNDISSPRSSKLMTKFTLSSHVKLLAMTVLEPQSHSLPLQPAVLELFDDHAVKHLPLGRRGSEDHWTRRGL